MRKLLTRISAPAAVLAMIMIPLAALPAAAMSVSPNALDIGASANSTGQIRVVNDGATALPIEIVVSSIELNEAGEATAPRPAGDDFLIFPPQALLAPGAAQSFRIQWAGDPQIGQSRTYVFSVNQVPVKMPKGKSGVQVVFNFATLVNVAPASGRAAIDLVSTGVGKDEKGKPRPTLTVKNPGNIHARLTDATISLSAGSWSHTLRPEQLRQTIGLGLVQPGKTRRFLLPLDLPAGVGPISARVDYKPLAR